MPAVQRGALDKRGRTWRAWYRDENGQSRSRSGFPTKSEAGKWLDRKLDDVEALRRGDVAAVRRQSMRPSPSSSPSTWASTTRRRITLRTSPQGCGMRSRVPPWTAPADSRPSASTPERRRARSVAEAPPRTFRMGHPQGAPSGALLRRPLTARRGERRAARPQSGAEAAGGSGVRFSRRDGTGREPPSRVPQDDGRRHDRCYAQLSQRTRDRRRTRPDDGESAMPTARRVLAARRLPTRRTVFDRPRARAVCRRAQSFPRALISSFVSGLRPAGEAEHR